MRTTLISAVLLAWSCTTAEPPPVPGLAVTEDELLLGGESVGLLKDVERFDDPNVPALEVRLREGLRSAPAVNPCDTIVLQPTTRFSLMKRVLFSCRAAGLEGLGAGQGAGGAVEALGQRAPAQAKAVEALLTPGKLRLQRTFSPRLGSLVGLEAVRSQGWASPMWAALSAPQRAEPGAQALGLPTESVGLVVEDAVSLSEVLEVVERFRAAGLSVDVWPATD